MVDGKKETILKTALFFDEKKREIIEAWLSRKNVSQILSKYNISRDSFGSDIAIEIVKYFIKVLKYEESVGQCPAMNRFVDLMYSKKMSIKEIFLICMGFRQTLFSLMIVNKKVDNDDPWVTELLSGILDKNFSSVLERFDELLLKESLEKQKEEYDRDFTKRILTILDLQENAIFKIRNNRLFLANSAFYETVGADSMQSFMLSYPEVWGFIEKVDRFETLFKTGKYEEWLKRCIRESDGKCEIELFDHRRKRKAQMQMSIRMMPKGWRGEYVVALQDITEQKAKLASVTQMVYTDALTQVPNRRKFEQMISAYMKRYENERASFFLMLIDIHNLTEINEILGRDAGDLILKRFARRVSGNLKKKDFFARIDGDRFAMLVRESDLSRIKGEAKDILRQLHDISYREEEGVAGNIAVVSCREEDSINSMLNRGDRIIQRIKEQGGDRVMDDTLLAQEDRKIKKAAKTFLEYCRRLSETKKPLEVVNYYLEIPIDSKAEIIRILGDLIWVKLRKVAIHTLRRNSEIFIKTEQKPHFKGVVEDIDKENMWVRIGGLEPVMHSPLDRNRFHVKLVPSIEGILCKERIRVPVDIETLSEDTVTVFLAYLTDLSVGDEIEIEATLRWNEITKNVKLPGTVKEIKKSRFTTRVVSSLNVSKTVKETLIQFVANRQLEIIKELKESMI